MNCWNMCKCELLQVFSKWVAHFSRNVDWLLFRLRNGHS
jgi:hypothetical protein